jgi:hypothetical protein
MCLLVCFKYTQKVLSTQTGEVLTARSCHVNSSSRMISVHWLRDSRCHGTSIQNNSTINSANTSSSTTPSSSSNSTPAAVAPEPIKEPMLLFVTNAGVELYCVSYFLTIPNMQV